MMKGKSKGRWGHDDAACAAAFKHMKKGVIMWLEIIFMFIFIWNLSVLMSAPSYLLEESHLLLLDCNCLYYLAFAFTLYSYLVVVEQPN